MSDLNSTTGRWTRQEHEAFLEGLKTHGRHWKKVATCIPTRTSAQTSCHAHAYFRKIDKEQKMEELEAERQERDGSDDEKENQLGKCHFSLGLNHSHGDQFSQAAFLLFFLSLSSFKSNQAGLR